jgi:hypothetical protein
MSYLTDNGDGRTKVIARDTGISRTGRRVQNNRSSTMTNTKTLMLAAAAALSLGLGSAMAQESAGGADVYSQPAFPGVAPMRHAPLSSQPQAGSSDVDPARAPIYPQQMLIGGDGNG